VSVSESSVSLAEGWMDRMADFSSVRPGEAKDRAENSKGKGGTSSQRKATEFPTTDVCDRRTNEQ
jgi:hypothetical protein